MLAGAFKKLTVKILSKRLNRMEDVQYDRHEELFCLNWLCCIPSTKSINCLIAIDICFFWLIVTIPRLISAGSMICGGNKTRLKLKNYARWRFRTWYGLVFLFLVWLLVAATWLTIQFDPPSLADFIAHAESETKQGQ